MKMRFVKTMVKIHNYKIIENLQQEIYRLRKETENYSTLWENSKEINRELEFDCVSLKAERDVYISKLAELTETIEYLKEETEIEKSMKDLARAWGKVWYDEYKQTKQKLAGAGMKIAEYILTEPSYSLYNGAIKRKMSLFYVKNE